MTMLRLWERLGKTYRCSPTFLLLSWFVVLILIGSILLFLPVSRHSGGPEISFLTALFTATSAACVTGLVVVDTPVAFSHFGQAVILVLIEMGGMGVVAFANLGMTMIGRRLSMSTQAALADTLFQNDAAREFTRTFRRIIGVVAGIQGLGVVVMAATLIPHHVKSGEGAWFALWSSLFHSVSAFCNAGFSIYENNLVPVSGNLAFMSAVVVLIILGGLGHVTLAELWRLPKLLRGQIRKPHWLSLNTRVVLLVTGILLVSGSLLVWLAGDGAGGALGHAVFQAVSARTAGFNSVNLDKLPLATCLFLCILMFIGGSPGSCAGGVKTTSLAIWLARIKANLRHESSVNILGFAIAPDLVSRARILMALSTLWNLAGVILLSLTQPEAGLDVILFEQVSAFGTVGMSMGLTPNLTDLSRLWIILTMCVGRMGPLTVILWAIPVSRATITRPQGRVMVG